MWAFDELHWQWGGCGLRFCLHVQSGVSCQDRRLITLAVEATYISQVLYVCRQPGNYRLMVKQGFGEIMRGRSVQGTVSHELAKDSFDSGASAHHVLQAWSGH